MTKKNGSDDEGGYGKPPKYRRFKKGQSGNPKGRPKGRSNIAKALERAQQQKVVVNENGRRRTVTKLEAALMQLVNKAASGDMSALKVLAALGQSVVEPEVVSEKQSAASSEIDQKVMKDILKRFQAGKGDKDEDDSDEG